MHEINTLSATDLVACIKHRKLSSEEVVKAYYARIEEVQPTINAMTQLTDKNTAIAQAKAADKAVAQGSRTGLLHGLPVTIKDTCKTKGFVCAKGCVGLRDYRPDTDATCVARIRDAGAIIIGQTNVSELMRSYEADNDLYGRTNNPYDLTRTPGGSSGGEAAIIAAGGSPLGMGSDAGGSIRQPAHNCGIAGLKPSHGRVPATGLIPEDGIGPISQLLTYGPMARYVDDLYLMLQVIAGPDGHDPHIVPLPLTSPDQVDISRLKIAFYTDNGIVPANQDVCDTLKQAVKALSADTSSVSEDKPPMLELTRHIVAPLFLGGDEGRSYLETMERYHVKTPSRLLQGVIKEAQQSHLTAYEFQQRLAMLEKFRIGITQFFERYDVILCPVEPTPAKLHGQSQANIKDYAHCISYNLAGTPAAVVRCGTSREGLPIGVQMVAKRFREDVALAVAKRLEVLLGGWQAPKW